MSACIGSPSANADALGFAATNGQRGPNSTYSVGGNGHAAAGHPTRSHNTQVVGESESSSSYQPYVIVNYMIKAKSNYGVMVMSAENAAVIDNLTSNSTTDALSAHQGKTLLNNIKGTILYSNNSGNTGTVTLSQAVENFDYLEIYFMDNVKAQCCVRHIPNGISQILNLTIVAIDNGVDCYIKNGQKTISGTSITAYHDNAECHVSSSAHTCYKGENYIKITKVIGYKYM